MEELPKEKPKIPPHFSEEEIQKLLAQIWKKNISNEEEISKAKSPHFSEKEIEKFRRQAREEAKVTKKETGAIMSAEDFMKMAEDCEKKFEETQKVEYLELAQTCRRKAERLEKGEK